MRHSVVICSYLFEHAINIDGVLKALVEEAWCMKEASCEGRYRVAGRVMNIPILTQALLGAS